MAGTALNSVKHECELNIRQGHAWLQLKEDNLGIITGDIELAYGKPQLTNK
ncbi:MAG: hypothetical protein GY818_15640 [Planctomycetaceae bacterium]|nr:hypothetical protein [Planctomycetaceae bacterium]